MSTGNGHTSLVSQAPAKRFDKWFSRYLKKCVNYNFNVSFTFQKVHILIKLLQFNKVPSQTAMTYQVTTFPMRPLGGFLTPNSLETRWNGYSVSMGNSMKTGPGVPDWAMASAFLTVGTISRMVLMDAQNLQSGLKRDIWSMSCSAPLPCMTSTTYETEEVPQTHNLILTQLSDNIPMSLINPYLTLHRMSCCITISLRIDIVNENDASITVTVEH